MYCEKCGKYINEDAVFCSECGAKVSKNSTPDTGIYRAPGVTYSAPAPVSTPAKTNVVAIISLILSIIGMFVVPLLFSSGGLLTGIIGCNVAVNNPNMKGKKMSIWGIILGAIGLVYGIIQFLITLG